MNQCALKKKASDLCGLIRAVTSQLIEWEKKKIRTSLVIMHLAWTYRVGLAIGGLFEW